MIAIAACLPMMLAGCNASGDVVRPHLPPRALVVADPVAVPEARAGQNAVEALAEVKSSAVENARRLRQAVERYDKLRAAY